MPTTRGFLQPGQAVRQDGSETPSPHSASRQIETYLRERILSGEWSAGHKLPSEAGLRKQFAASRTAVREAIRSLAGRGLLETVNGSGSYVSGGGLEHVAQALNAYSVLGGDGKSFGDLLELRMAIEGDAAAKVASRQNPDDWPCLERRLADMESTRVLEEFAILDIDFHMELLRLSENELFMSLGQALRDRYVRFAIDSYRTGERLREETVAEHRQILRAIITGDAAAARDAARRHVSLAKSRWECSHRDDAPADTSRGGVDPR